PPPPAQRQPRVPRGHRARRRVHGGASAPGRGQPELPVTVGIARIKCLMTASGLGPATGAADLEQVYRDLHANPELSRQEHRTAALAGGQLAAAGFDVTTNIGGTGVAGVL